MFELTFPEEESTENEFTNPQLHEFSLVANQLTQIAPDADTGLATLRDAYQSYGFEGNKEAQDAFVSYSDKVRIKHNDTEPYNYDSTIALAPFGLDEITGEGPDENSRTIDSINKWEEKNLKYLSETDDPSYLQGKQQLTRGLKQIATIKRREVYGADNYIATDLTLRAAQGLVGGLASAAGVTSVNDWFVENTDPEMDGNFWADLSSGAGNVAGAIAAGAVAGPIGAATYLGATGVGAVREQFNEGIEAGNTTYGAVAGAALEAGNQIIQSSVGGKIFGEIGTTLVKKVAGETVEKLGARVFPKIASNFLIEGTTEGIGQVVSNTASNTAKDENKDVTEGAGRAFVIGGVLAGATTGAVEAFAGRSPNASPENDALKNTIQDIEGSPPPPPETVPAPRQSVDVPNTTAPVFVNEDGSQVIADDGKFHYKVGDKVQDSFDNQVYVTPEVAQRLRDNQQAPDGTAVTLKMEDGTLYAESDFLNEDLSVATDKTGTNRRAIPAEKAPRAGLVAVQVDNTRTQDGVRQNGFFIGTSPIKDVSQEGSVGAAKLGTIDGYKESIYLQKLRATHGDEWAERRGMVTINEDGTQSLWNYLPLSNVEGSDIADKKIASNGILGSIAELQNKDAFNAEDNYVLSKLDFQMQKAILEANKRGDYIAEEGLVSIHSDIIAQKSRVVGEAGRIMQSQTQDAQAIIGGVDRAEVPIVKIKTALRKDAQVEISKELGQDVTFLDLDKQVKAADQEVAAVEKEINDPVEIELANIDSEIETINSNKEGAYTQRIEKYNQEINQLEQAVTTETEAVKSDLSETAKGIQESISDTNKEVEAIQKDVADRQAKGKKPLSAQAQRLQKLNARLARLDAEFAETGERAPKQAAPVKRLRSLIAQRKKEIRSLEKEQKLPRELTPRQKQLQAKKQSIIEARQEGRIEPDKETKLKLKKAKDTQREAKRRLDRAKTILEEKFSKFTPQEEQDLRNFYTAIDKVSDGTAKAKILDAIFDIEAKHLPPDPDRVSQLYSYYVGNLLSGPDTLMRNAIGNLSNVAGNVASYAVTGAARGSLDSVAYSYGLVQGLISSGPEIGAILTGKKYGRQKLDSKGGRKTAKSLGNLTSLQGLGNLAMSPVEIARRVMSATDVALAKSAEEGMHYMLQYIAAEKAKVPMSERKQWVEDRLYRTGAKIQKISNDIDRQAEILAKAGIQMSENEKKIMLFERMQGERDAASRAIAERHGDRSVFMQDPEGILGLAANTINYAATHEQATVTLGGKKIQPLKHVFPFVRTVANVANAMLDFEPITGTVRAVSKSRNPELQMEAREHAGKAMLGAVMLGGLFSIAYQYKDDEKPWLEFYGNIPKGKYREWQEKQIQPYSMRVGDTVIGGQGTVLGLVFGILGGATQSAKNNDSIPLIAMNATIAAMGTIATQSFLKNVGDVFNTVVGVESPTEGSGKAEKNFYNAFKGGVVNQVSGFIPNAGFLKNVGRWMEASPVETYNNFSAKLLGQMPFARDLGIGEPKLNMFGKPIEKTLMDRTAAGSFLSSTTTHPVMLWMMESGYKITDQGPIIKLNDKEQTTYGAIQQRRYGYSDILTEEQSREVLKIAGPQIESYLNSVRTTAGFKTLSKKNQDKINDEVSKIRGRAKLQVLSR